MKKREIVCYQFEVWPRPQFGKPYTSKTVYARPDELIFGYLFTRTPNKKVAGWRIKKLNK